MGRGTDRAVQRGCRRRRPGTSSSRGDEGVTLVELLVAVAVIVIVLLPTTIFVIQAQKTVSAEHLEAEAINVATRQLETLQLEAGKGTLPTGTTTEIYPVGETGSRVTKFRVETSWTTVTQGTNQSICSSDADVAQQIWLVTAVVTWPGMGSTSPVVQTTEIAPAQAGAVQQFEGEVAVRIQVDPTDLFVADPVTATVTGTWSGSGSAPAVPDGTFTTETASTASTSSALSNGCIVFENLDADSNANGSWQYTLSFAGNTGPPPLVSSDEHADSNPNGALTVAVPPLEPGVPNVVTVTLDTGTTVNIAYTGPGGSCTIAPSSPVSPPVSPSTIPVSVENSFLTTYSNNTWIAYGTTPFSSLLLFPWSGVTGLWTGDQPDSAPSLYGSYTPAPIACGVNAVSGGQVSVYLPVYPLNLTYSGSPTLMSAKEVAGNAYSMALNFGSGHSNTSLPLGEYQLFDNNGPMGPSAPYYVWVTPAGECHSGSVSATPPSQSACNGSTLAVTAP
ncbi:MAG: prepilin-type N-terminal cleavage/methylation domain-containing protein [Acidimicrobiales bacterium]